jgi:hypothetical protein
MKKKTKRCLMAWARTDEHGDEHFEQCIRIAIDGDEVCEPCRERCEGIVQHIVQHRQRAQHFKKLLTDSASTAPAKNGDATAPGHRSKSR